MLKTIEGVRLQVAATATDEGTFSVAAPADAYAQVLGWISRNSGPGGRGWAWRPYNGDGKNPMIGPAAEQKWHGPCQDEENALRLLFAFWLRHRPQPAEAVRPGVAGGSPSIPLSLRERTLLVYALGRLRKELTEDRDAGTAAAWPRPADVDALTAKVAPKEEDRI